MPQVQIVGPLQPLYFGRAVAGKPLSEISPEFLERLTDMVPELVEGGSGAFEPDDFAELPLP